MRAKDAFSSLWEKIALDKTPGTTPIADEFWERIDKNLPVLEVGCGWGRVIFECMRRHLEVVGIDINANEVKGLREKLTLLNLPSPPKIYVESIASTHFKAQTFGAVIMQGVLSALIEADRKVAVQEVFRLMKVGAFVHIAEFELVDNDPAYAIRYQKDFGVTQEYGTLSVTDDLGKELYRTHNFSEQELRELLEVAGLEVVKLVKDSFASYHGNIKPGLIIISRKN